MKYVKFFTAELFKNELAAYLLLHQKKRVTTSKVIQDINEVVEDGDSDGDGLSMIKNKSTKIASTNSDSIDSCNEDDKNNDDRKRNHKIRELYSGIGFAPSDGEEWKLVKEINDFRNQNEYKRLEDKSDTVMIHNSEFQRTIALVPGTGFSISISSKPLDSNTSSNISEEDRISVIYVGTGNSFILTQLFGCQCTHLIMVVGIVSVYDDYIRAIVSRTYLMGKVSCNCPIFTFYTYFFIFVLI